MWTAHHICELAGLPPPDIDPKVPTFPLHGGGSAADADADTTPAYLRHTRGSAQEADGFSFDGDGSASISESITTASEYSAQF